MTVDPELAAVEEIAASGTVAPPDVARLVDALGASRKAVQRRAAEVLAALATRSREAYAALRAAAGSGPLRRRFGAAFALATLGPLPDECLPILVEVLGEADGDLRWAAATLLVGTGASPALRAVLRALVREGNAAQRKMALYCLRDLGTDGDALAPEIEQACGDVDAGVRLAAMAALARLAADRGGAARLLVARLRDDEAGVRRAAAAALARLGWAEPCVSDALAAAAGDADPALRRAARDALRRLGLAS